jgi:hypothetical protein
MGNGGVFRGDGGFSLMLTLIWIVGGIAVGIVLMLFWFAIDLWHIWSSLTEEEKAGSVAVYGRGKTRAD